jgi:hypothetical protein
LVVHRSYVAENFDGGGWSGAARVDDSSGKGQILRQTVSSSALASASCGLLLITHSTNKHKVFFMDVFGLLGFSIGSAAFTFSILSWLQVANLRKELDDLKTTLGISAGTSDSRDGT